MVIMISQEGPREHVANVLQVLLLFGVPMPKEVEARLRMALAQLDGQYDCEQYGHRACPRCDGEYCYYCGRAGMEWEGKGYHLYSDPDPRD